MTRDKMWLTGGCIALSLLTVSLASGADAPSRPDPKDLTVPVVLALQDYLGFGDKALQAILAASDERPAPQVVSIGVDAHSSAFFAGPGLKLWHYRFDRLWAGQPLADVADSLHHLPGIRQFYRSWSGHPVRAIILEVSFSRALDYNYRQDNGPEYDLGQAGLRRQNAAARSAGTPLVLYGIPWGSITSLQGKDKPWTPETYTAEVDRIEAGSLNLLLTVDAPIAATWRAFAVLKREHPEFDLHAPVGNWDGHLTEKDRYVAACAVAAVILNRRPTEIPDEAQEAIFAQWDEGCKKAGYGAKLNMTFPTRLSRTELTAIHDAVWKAKQSFDADLAKLRAEAKVRAQAWAKDGPSGVAEAVRAAYAKPDRDGTLDLTVSLLDDPVGSAGLVALLKHAETAARQAAARAIRRSGLQRPALRDGLIEAIRAETDPDTRRELSWALGIVFGDDATAQAFLKPRAADPAVPEHEARGIIQSVVDLLTTEERIRFLDALFQGRQPDAARIEAIVRVGRAWTPSLIESALSRGDEKAVGYMERMEPGPGLSEPLKAAMAKHPAQAIRLAGLLMGWDDAAGVETLVRLQREGDDSQRPKALGMLLDRARQVRSPVNRTRVIGALMEALKRGETREPRVIELCQHMLPESLPYRDLVASFVNDKDERLAKAAAAVLPAMDSAKPKQP